MTSRSSTQWSTAPIVKDLGPDDLQRPAPPRPRTALEIAKASVAMYLLVQQLQAIDEGKTEALHG